MKQDKEVNLLLVQASNKKNLKDYCNVKEHSLIFLILTQLKETKMETYNRKDSEDIQELKELLII